MPLPIAGEAVVTLLDANPVSIHGDLYVDLAMKTGDDEPPTMARVSAHLFPALDGVPQCPAAGARLVVRVLLGQIDAVRMATEDDA